MALIHTIQLFSKQQLSHGGSGTSQVLDLRNLAQVGNFALSFKSIAGTAGSAGTTIYTYTQCSEREGTFITPTGAYAIGTAGGGGTPSDIVAFSPVLAPYMKIIATQTGVSGTAALNGKDSKISAELIIR